MKTYLFGVSRLLEKLSRGGYLREFRVEGLFDNAREKQGEKKWGFTIEPPTFYDSDIKIVITVKELYHMAMIHQLLDMGYRKFTTFHAVSDGRYEKVEYDYSQYDYEHDKNSLVLLYLEHRSYSNICALTYLKEAGYLNCYDFRLKLTCCAS